MKILVNNALVNEPDLALHIREYLDGRKPAAGCCFSFQKIGNVLLVRPLDMQDINLFGTTGVNYQEFKV